MKELTSQEVGRVQGGMIPFIVAVVAFDAGLIGSMWVASKGLER